MVQKTRIFQLKQEEGVVEGEEWLKEFITKYYKNLFGPSHSCGGGYSSNYQLGE
jgi:hypothetical protein